MCGEKTEICEKSNYAWGSPPHVRGKASACFWNSRKVGITPACAGKSEHSDGLGWHSWDHPRMCGEKTNTLFICKCKIGITPACAGKRKAQLCMLFRSKDHPRMCGEKALNLNVVLMHLGSPPHVRGKASDENNSKDIRRITPACAGKSFCATSFYPLPRDHPRMCGEKVFEGNKDAPGRGSPPHVRGKVRLVWIFASGIRITPACAGKRPILSGANTLYRDHPRMCGEKNRLPSSICTQIGSPPHVRGKAHN